MNSLLKNFLLRLDKPALQLAIRRLRGRGCSLFHNETLQLQKTGRKRFGNGGYSLVELSISTSVIAMLAVGGIAILQKKNDAAQAKNTLNKLEKIEHALKGYIRTNGFIPCPALASSLESSTNFGVSVSYDTTSKTCNGNGLANEVGAVPVRTLGLSADYSYDGWERKFAYRSASASGIATDFGNVNFKGNIAIIDAQGMHKTNINQPPPYNDAAIYLIISSGANGKNAAYARNSTTAPTGATGIEAKNSDHTRNIYVQNEKTAIFDDIVFYGTAAKLSPQQVMESPIRIDDSICDTTQSITNSGRRSLDSYAVATSPNGGRRDLDGYQGSEATTGSASGSSLGVDTIFKSASKLAMLCKNRRVSETVGPDRVNGLQLWLDANDIGTLLTNSDCTGDLSSPQSQATIACWKDKSGNGNNATNRNAGPTLSSSGGINGKQGLSFDGTSNSLSISSTPSVAITQDMTIFGVINITDYRDSRVLISKTSSNIPAPYDYYFSSHEANFLKGNGSSSQGFNGGVVPDASNNIVSVVSSGNNIYHYLNGAANGSGLISASTSVADAGNQLLIGTRAARDIWMKGIIGEILLYNQPLSRFDRNKIEEYLADKWGITIAASTSTCQNGMVFKKSANNPQGSCQCPDGKAFIRDLKTANACYEAAANTSTGQCVALATAPTYQNPPSKADMILWLDANDCTTITLASGNDASALRTWRDKSGNLGANSLPYQATQYTSSNQPLYVKNTQNGLPVVRFDGATDSITAPVNISRSSMANITISTVYQVRSGGASNQALWGQNSSSTNINDRYALLFNNGGTVGISNGSGLQAVSRIGNTANWQILTTTLTSSSGSNAWINGQSTINNGNGFTESGVVSVNNEITIGNIGSGGVYPAKVDIGEMIIYNAALSNTKRRVLEKYLATKWGIAITPDIPSGLNLWLDAADISTVYTTNNCDTISSNNSKIGCWSDKSGKNRNATQTDDAQKPVYFYGAAINPTISFNGSSAYLNTDLSFLKNSPYTIFAADIRMASGNSYLIGSTTEFSYGYQNNLFQLAHGNNALNVALPSGFSSEPSISIGYLDTTVGRSAYYYPNSSHDPSSNTNTTTLASADHGVLGMGNGSYYNGYINEIVIYNRALSTFERATIARYLGDKWGVTVP